MWLNQNNRGATSVRRCPNGWQIQPQIPLRSQWEVIVVANLRLNEQRGLIGAMDMGIQETFPRK